MKRSMLLLAAMAVLFLLVSAVTTMVRRPMLPTAAQLARQRTAAPAGMVFVPAGVFWMGSNDPDADADAQPRRRVFVPSFYIGRTEVTNAQYGRFRPEYKFTKGHEGYPVTELRWEEAEAYARWRGGRLPTEAEWEKAARGTDGRRYPWGDTLSPARANYRRDGKAAHKSAAGGTCALPGAGRGLKPVGSYPTGASPYGALDMAGNAWEWVYNYYEGDHTKRIIRGGAFGYGEGSLRTYARAIEGAGVT